MSVHTNLQKKNILKLKLIISVILLKEFNFCNILKCSNIYNPMVLALDISNKDYLN